MNALRATTSALISLARTSGRTHVSETDAAYRVSKIQALRQ
jgi:hypothetical protein